MHAGGKAEASGPQPRSGLHFANCLACTRHAPVAPMPASQAAPCKRPRPRPSHRHPAPRQLWPASFPRPHTVLAHRRRGAKLLLHQLDCQVHSMLVVVVRHSCLLAPGQWPSRLPPGRCGTPGQRARPHWQSAGGGRLASAAGHAAGLHAPSAAFTPSSVGRPQVGCAMLQVLEVPCAGRARGGWGTLAGVAVCACV